MNMVMHPTLCGSDTLGLSPKPASDTRFGRFGRAPPFAYIYGHIFDAKAVDSVL